MSNLSIPTNDETPFVSIGIPVYNSEATLAAAIESALAQDYVNLEILISDNASIDNSAEICRNFQKRDSRIIFYQQSENIGPLENFVFLLRKATGEYFKWLAADDVISNNSISSSVNNLINSPNNIACSVPHLFDHEARINKKPISFRLNGPEFSRINSFFRSPGRSHGLLYSLINRNALTSYPLLSVDFFAWDWCLVVYLLSHGPMGTAQDTYLISGSNGLSSTRSIYKHYGLTGWKRILPLQQFTLKVMKTSSNWTISGRIFLFFKLILLNLKNGLLEYRILRYKFSDFRKYLFHS
jgi:glycosyltransferase involved in cell wall biosynthesis